MIRQTYMGCSVALACFLAACAVGPNFKKPEAPRTDGFTPPDEIPAQLGAAASPDTQPQHFVDGLDIQGQWWTLFQSPALNALIERALTNSPTLEAATAALRQANETLAAERGSYYPSLSAAAGVQRQKEPGAALGLPQLPSVIYTLNSHPERLLHAGCFWRNSAPGRIAWRASRVRTLCSRGRVPEPNRQFSHRRNHRSLAAGATCRDPRHRRFTAHAA